jgi:hypothetical protein
VCRTSTTKYFDGGCWVAMESESEGGWQRGKGVLPDDQEKQNNKATLKSREDCEGHAGKLPP